MKAARLNQVGKPLEVMDVPEPEVRLGSVLVRVEAARILSYTNKVFGSDYKIPVPAPYTPGTGCIGRIEVVAEDVTDLKPGQRVYCDPDVVSHANILPRLSKGDEPLADGILNGWFGLTSASEGLLRYWKDGSFAEKALYPLECVTPIDDEETAASHLICLANLAVAYGGLLRGELKPGQIVIVNGAAGNIGTAAVVMALAMGAAKIVVVGRDAEALEELSRLAPRRIVSVAADGQAEENIRKVANAAGGAHLTLDALGAVPDPDPTLAGLYALRPGGCLVLMGGVTADIPLPYGQMLLMGWTVRGSFMYPTSAPGDLLRMLAAGTLDLSPFRPRVFPLEQVTQAVTAAAAMKGLDICVLAPN